jgi:hypothetical protein
VDEPGAVQGYSDVLSQVVAEGKPLIVRRNGADLAAVLPLEYLEVLLTAALARGMTDSSASSEETVDSAALMSEETFPVPGTLEWGQMNRRRAELIRKKVRSVLTAQEQAEYEFLQRMSLATVNRTYPRPPVDLASLQRLAAELQGNGEVSSE